MRYLEDSDYEDEIARVLESGESRTSCGCASPPNPTGWREAGGLYDLSDMVTRSSLDISKYGQSLDIVQLDDGFIPLPFIQNMASIL